MIYGFVLYVNTNLIQTSSKWLARLYIRDQYAKWKMRGTHMSQNDNNKRGVA